MTSHLDQYTLINITDGPQDRILTNYTDDFMIGDRVWVNGEKPGYIQYIGDVKFAPGEWAGVVLDDPLGVHDGTVLGTRYFQCGPNRGVFSRLWCLTRYPMFSEKFRISPSQSIDLRKARSANLELDDCPLHSRSPSPRYRHSDDDLRLGDRVMVATKKGMLSGWLRFMGRTQFAPGHWAGIELEEPLGTHDGSMAGTRYFYCPKFYGIFSPCYKVNKMSSLESYRSLSRMSLSDRSRLSPEI